VGVKKDPILEKVREICLRLPDTKLTMTWGKPHFRVGEKIFCGCGEEGGGYAIGFKLEKPHAAKVLRDPRFRVAPYVGKHGWVQLDATKVRDWGEVRRWIEESYELIAPTKSLKKLETARK
jgi:predicted DNA-binding protein (MmcQ/YjbR family)